MEAPGIKFKIVQCTLCDKVADLTVNREKYTHLLISQLIPLKTERFQKAVFDFCTNCIGLLDTLDELQETIQHIIKRINEKKNTIKSKILETELNSEDIDVKNFRNFATEDFCPRVRICRRDLFQIKPKIVSIVSLASRKSEDNDFHFGDGLEYLCPYPSEQKLDVVKVEILNSESVDDDYQRLSISDLPSGNNKMKIETKKAKKRGRPKLNPKDSQLSPESRNVDANVVAVADIIKNRVQEKRDEIMKEIEEAKLAKAKNSTSQNLKTGVILGRTNLKVKRKTKSGRPNTTGKRHNPLLTRKKDYLPVKNSCRFCKKLCRDAADLKRHIVVHTGEKNHACDICGMKFGTDTTLYYHKRIHTGIKPHSCDFCEMKFFAGYQLKRHRRTHTGEKLYECEICHKRFTRKERLGSHLRIHSGERYPCKICGKKYRRQGTLLNHKKKHSNEKGES